ncbi:MAG: dolichyl-phosphate beta-glucosyltransferase [Nanoarchaeota archaeon]|nr:dolichyl-phosphate beta-glucosyltransferase [Nanoarchaeota archaeon]
MKKISIVIPAYNEEKRIGKTLKNYLEYFRKLKAQKLLEYEILVVINNTTDKTEEVVKSFRNNEIRYLNFKKGGKGFAIIEGFRDALDRKNDLIGFVDADGATPPNAFYWLVQNIGNYDGVIASRWMKKSKIIVKQNLKRRILSRGFNFTVRSLFMFPYQDTQCGAKLFKREVIEIILNELSLTHWAFDINLLFSARQKGFRIKEFPTIWEDKDESKVSSSKTSVQMFLGILRLRLIYSPFEKLLRPVKFILVLGDRLVNG